MTTKPTSERRRSRRRRTAAAGAVVVLNLPLGSEPAGSTHAVATFPWLMNRSVPTHYSGLTADAAGATDHARSEVNRTVMSYYKVSSHPGENSISAVDELYPDDWNGQWSCQEKIWIPDSQWPYSRYYCIHGHVRYNLSNMSGTSPGFWKHVACHEFGHSAGIAHQAGSSGSCVDSLNDSHNQSTALSSHDVSTINQLHP